jgi:glycosyltransferase involved in cell wall biosynthesis
MSAPFFSVLLPAFNAQKHIRAAIRDILAQSFRDFELLIVDDGSTDGTSEIAAQFNDPRLHLIRLPTNRGLVAALNEGLNEARGQWIARQDADDRCRWDRLEKQACLISRNPEAIFIYSQARLIDANGFWRGRLRPPAEDAGLRWDFCFRNPVPHTSAVFSLKIGRDQLGGYRNCKACEDYDLWSRLLRNGMAIGSSEALVSYRNHAGSIMGREHAAQAERKNSVLRQIMTGNLQEWLDASQEEADLVVTAWLDPVHSEWEKYFDVTTRMAGERIHPSPRLLAEQDFTLLNRAAAVSRESANQMLSALQKISPSRYASLPQPRTFLTRLIKHI